MKFLSSQYLTTISKFPITKLFFHFMKWLWEVRGQKDSFFNFIYNINLANSFVMLASVLW